MANLHDQYSRASTEANSENLVRYFLTITSAESSTITYLASLPLLTSQVIITDNQLQDFSLVGFFETEAPGCRSFPFPISSTHYSFAGW